MKTIFLYKISIVVAFFIPAISWGYTYQCIHEGGIPLASTSDFGSFDISDPNQNAVGKTFTNAASWDNGAKSTVVCDCDPSTNKNYQFYYVGKSPLPADEGGFYVVNDYLSVQTKIYLAGIGYLPIPINGNMEQAAGIPASQACGTGTDLSAGSKGQISLKIRKSFVGEAFFNNAHIADMYAYAYGGTSSGISTPYMSVYLSGKVTVPQSCIINAGSTVTVNLGSLYMNDFGAAGQKPSNYTPKTFTVPIQCNDMSATANITLRVQGTASTEFPNALQSNNSDVGVIITDSSGNTLKPNDPSSTIPLKLDDANHENVIMYAYPVGTTNNTPAIGQFTTLAYLRVDFA